ALSSLRKEYEPYSQSGEVNYTVSDQAAALAAVAAAFSHGGLDHLDGLTVDLGDRWFNVRPSNTEPKLRLNAEGPDPEAVAALVAQVESVLAGWR
ncbi:MAG: phosphomannomutase/phosphoglucomutase, partial [Actinobacteria bacterium]